MVEDGGGGKLRDPQKILVLQVVSRVQAAAGQEGVLDAGGEDIPKADFQVKVVQLLQQTVRRIIAQVLQMVPIGFVHGALGLLHERPAEVPLLRRAVLPVQSLDDSGVMIFPQLPQVGRPRPPNRAGVGYVKDIIQAGPAAAILMNERDALRTRLHPPPHGIVPQLHAGAVGGIRALGVEQELVVEGVFLKLLSRRNLRFLIFSLPTRKSGLSRSRKSRSARTGRTASASAWGLSRSCCPTPSR